MLQSLKCQHYAAIRCPRHQTTGPAVQLAGIPPFHFCVVEMRVPVQAELSSMSVLKPSFHPS